MLPNTPYRIFFIFVLLILTLSPAPAPAGVLSKLTETRITIEAHQGLEYFGMTKETVHGHVANWLRLHIPRLEVKNSVAPFIHVSILLQERIGTAHGYVNVRVVRKVTINELGQVVFGGVWQTGGLVASEVSQTQTFVFESLDRLLTKLARQWERDNR